VDYERKMQFWTEIISTSCKHLGDPVINLAKMKTRCRRRDQIAAPLPTVLQEMHRTKQIQPVSEIMAGSDWFSWGYSLVSSSVSWLLGSGTQTEENGIDFVHLDTLKMLADKVLKVHGEQEPEADDASNLVEYCTLRDQCQKHFATQQAFDLALQYLLSQGHISVHKASTGEKIIKFREERENGPVRSTETDTNIHDVRKAMSKLEKEVSRLEDTAKRCEQDARTALRAGNKGKAKNMLRQKQLVMKQLTDKDNQYGHLLQMLHQLGQSRQNKQVLDAYKSGVQAFKRNLDRHGMSTEKIDETMDEVQDAMADFEELSHALSSGGPHRDTSDMDELEKELAELIEEPVRDPLEDLPAVPDDSISTSVSVEERDASGDRLQRLRQQLHAG